MLSGDVACAALALDWPPGVSLDQGITGQNSLLIYRQHRGLLRRVPDTQIAHFIALSQDEQQANHPVEMAPQ